MKIIFNKIADGVCFIRTLLFIFGLWVFSAVCGTIAFIAYPFPYRFRYTVSICLWSYLTLFWMWLTCGVRFKVLGKENIPKTPSVFLSKHSSTWETIALPIVLSAPSIVIKKQLLRIPFFGWGLGMCEPIVIDRQQRKRAMQLIVSQGKRYLGFGRQILLFPEGTRGGGEYKSGGAVLAKEANVPIVPIAHTAADCWPRYRFNIKPGKIYVVIGKPIVAKGKSPEELIAEVKTWIEGVIEKRPWEQELEKNTPIPAG